MRVAPATRPRFLNYLHEVQDRDLTLGLAMTDAKGDRSLRAGGQANPDVYVRIKERRPDGMMIRGTKAIVTGAPYMHGFLVMPCRTHMREDADFAVCCAVPIDAPGVTVSLARRPAGRGGGEILGQIRSVDWRRRLRRRFRAARSGLPRGRDRGGRLPHDLIRDPSPPFCIGARAGFGDLLIGAGALMVEANGLDPDRHGHIRDQMADLIAITESFFACGVAASAYCTGTRPAR